MREHQGIIVEDRTSEALRQPSWESVAAHQTFDAAVIIAPEWSLPAHHYRRRASLSSPDVQYVLWITKTMEVGISSPDSPKGWRRLPRTLLALSRARTVESPDQRELVERLLMLASNAREHQHFSQFVQSSAPGWVSSRVPAVAAVIEAASRLSLEGADNLICVALEDKGTPSWIASIAGQRIRLLKKTGRDLRPRMWRALRERIDAWARDPADTVRAMVAMPSVPLVAGEEGAAFLARHVRLSSPNVARAAADAVLDWASGVNETARCRDDECDLLWCALNERWGAERAPLSTAKTQDSGALRAHLLWAMGGVAGESRIDETARCIVESFSVPYAGEDAASVRTGRLLELRHGAKAVSALGKEFGGLDSPLFPRFQALLLKVA